MKNTVTLFLLSALFFVSEADAQTTSGFDGLTLYPGSFWDGSDQSGGFQDGNVWFNNTFDSTYFYWSGGFAYSNVNDSTTSGYGNLYAAKAYTDYSGTGNYALGQQGSILRLTGSAAGKAAAGVYITNTTYAANSMRDGDAFAKKFGGTTGNDPDWFRLTVYGFSNGNLTTDSVDFYLADFRSPNNADDYIVETWEWVDLSALGNVDSLIFFLSSTDNGSWGMNTPAFFALDNFTTADSPASVEETDLSVITVFPNPATNFIKAELNENYSVKIFSMSGQLVKSENISAGNSMDVSDLDNGIYLVDVITGESVNQLRNVIKLRIQK